jgi:flagellar hook assembly protein FlgD
MIVVPENNELFVSSGDFKVEEVIAANQNGYVDAIVAEFSLNKAYPNPFNPTTNIKLSLAEQGMVSMKVFNITGQLVDVLADGYMDAGYHTFVWNGSNVPSGIYFVKVIAGSNVSTQKLMLLK